MLLFKLQTQKSPINQTHTYQKTPETTTTPKSIQNQPLEKSNNDHHFTKRPLHQAANPTSKTQQQPSLHQAANSKPNIQNQPL